MRQRISDLVPDFHFSHLDEFCRFSLSLIKTLSPLLIVTALGLAVQALIDPYGFFGAPSVQGFNEIRPAQWPFGRIYKPFAFGRGHYDGLILGASHEERGFDPDSPALVAAGFNLYNFALVEERLYETKAIMELTERAQFPKLVIMGLDLTLYNLSPADFHDERVYYPRDSLLLWSMEQAAKLMVSEQGIGDTYRTVAANLTPQQLPSSDVQSQYAANGLLRVLPIHPAERKNYREVFGGVLTQAWNDEYRVVLAHSGEWMKHGSNHSLIKEIIKRAVVHDGQLVFVIPPDHILAATLLRRIGLWPVFERWKREMVCVLHEYPNAHIGIWDFSGANEVTLR